MEFKFLSIKKLSDRKKITYIDTRIEFYNLLRSIKTIKCLKKSVFTSLRSTIYERYLNLFATSSYDIESMFASLSLSVREGDMQTILTYATNAIEYTTSPPLYS